MRNTLNVNFHNYLDSIRPELVALKPIDVDLLRPIGKTTTTRDRKIGYRFYPHFHPYADALMRRLIEGSVAGLQAADTEEPERLRDAAFFKAGYNPPLLPADVAAALDGGVTEAVFNKLPDVFVAPPFPVKDLDFSSPGAYSVYNWELFYHVPLTLGIQLSKNGRYAEAQRRLHDIFDPTDDGDGLTPERFWKCKPLRRRDVRTIEEVLTNLSANPASADARETQASIGAWKDGPFRPHVLARYRPTAYMYKAVMAYLDNLIAWGDSLFAQDTGEAINEATQLYVLAANILGPKPQAVPKKGSIAPQSYATLRGKLDDFGNTLREIETDILFDLAPHPADADTGGRIATLRSIGKALYFCIPRNAKLLGYWDAVADRLFKIRNSLNLQGVFRQLPLFEPPIDPAMLARAVAAGLDVGAVVAGANQPLPLVRFQFLLAKATEICQEVKSLGANLLSTIEKKDNEALAVLRARHERVVLGLAESVKYAQWQEAIKAREGLEKSLANAAQRYTYYERLLGKQDADIKLPELTALESEGLISLKFKSAEPAVAPRDVPISLARDANSEGGGRVMNDQEAQELDRLKSAREKQEAAGEKERAGAGLSLIPEIGVDFHFWGLGGHLAFGGSALSRAMSFWASFARADSDKLGYQAGNAAKIGGYARREQEWAFQSNAAAGEVTLLFKQIRGAQIREAIAEREWHNHQQQIKHSEEVEQFLADERTGKQANLAFYAWMKGEVRALYNQCFQFAFNVARKAERALQHELGDPNLTFLQFSYMAGNEGLLAGEKLHLDLKRMEMAYHDLNQREYEITKYVSLLQVDPVALMQLRANGSCTVALPEELFDFECPGHYFRRIRSVAVTIPCVTGPYTGVNCTLTLLKSGIRTRPTLPDGGYARTGPDDDRFSDHFGPIQSIVTSTGQNDTGVAADRPDDRRLPFEGSGVVSEWRLGLPDHKAPKTGGGGGGGGGAARLRPFDYDTISDVILQIRHTAREGGQVLRAAASANLADAVSRAAVAGSVRLFSIRHEFPSAWAKFMAAPDAGDGVELKLTLKDEHYPSWAKGRRKAVRTAHLFARAAAAQLTVIGPSGLTDELSDRKSLAGLLTGRLENAKPNDATGDVSLKLKNAGVDDLWLALQWAIDP